MKGKVIIRIEGLLGEQWQTLFPGMDLSHHNGNTLLEGTIADEAHLHGIFNLIRNYNLKLISINPAD